MLHEKSRTVSKALIPAALCAIVLMAAGCGGKDESSAPQSSSQSAPTHTVSASEHEAFEKKYVEMCIKSQQANAGTQLTNDQELGKVCGCMAKDVSQRLSKAEVVHFLDKKEFPIELVMMTDAAANHCLSQTK